MINVIYWIDSKGNLYLEVFESFKECMDYYRIMGNDTIKWMDLTTKKHIDDLKNNNISVQDHK